MRTQFVLLIVYVPPMGPLKGGWHENLISLRIHGVFLTDTKLYNATVLVKINVDVGRIRLGQAQGRWLNSEFHSCKNVKERGSKCKELGNVESVGWFLTTDQLHMEQTTNFDTIGVIAIRLKHFPGYRLCYCFLFHDISRWNCSAGSCTSSLSLSLWFEFDR